MLAFLFSWLFVVFVAALACSGQVQESRLILLDGSAVPFESLEIVDGRVSGTGLAADLTLDDLRRIEVAGELRTAGMMPAVTADLRGGGRVLATNATIGDDHCRLEWEGGETLALPLDVVRALRLEPATTNAEFEKAVATPAAELDRVFVKDEAGKLSSVAGLIESLTAEELTLEAGGQSRKLPRAGVFGIVVAQPTATDPAPRCLLMLKDGSLLGGDDMSLAQGVAQLSFAGGGSVKLPWSAVSHVAIRSRRVAFLSDLKPADEQERRMVTLPRPWQRDKAVTGKPLMLGGRSYEKGLGVHARSLLTFAAEKKWDVLAATIGLDSASGSKGDCVFVVLADGQPLVTRRLTGGDAPEEIRVAITGREQVTLLVEPGEGLDLGDHANWGDVRFVKNRE